MVGCILAAFWILYGVGSLISTRKGGEDVWKNLLSGIVFTTVGVTSIIAFQMSEKALQYSIVLMPVAMGIIEISTSDRKRISGIY